MKKDVKLVFEDGNQLDVYNNTTVRDILKELDDDQIIALRINGRLVAPDYEVNENSFVTYIKISDRIGHKIYIKGLEYVYINAVKDVFGDKVVVNVKHSLDKALYTELDGKITVTNEVVKKIKKRMQEICDKDMYFKSVSVSRDDAYEYVNKLGEYEKALNYRFMTNESVTMYELNNEYNYFNYIMPASTKILSRFDLTYVAPNGIVLSYPIGNIIPKFKAVPGVLKAFKNYEQMLASIGIRYAGQLNKLIVDGKAEDFVQMNELLYDQSIGMIVQKIANNRNIKSVFISGPSSSGKTTTSKKLALFLKTLGIDSLLLSTDDYFVERKDGPRKEDGSYEYEIIDALDIELFNDHVKKLLSGEEVVIPTYNFLTGEKEFKTKPISLGKNQLLIVEGLHAINEKMNAMVPKKNKLKLYISPFTPLATDRHNHISTTDIRLLRRMVRDNRHRGYDAEATLTNWAGMRSSEENYVYPYQREADIVVNTSLAYEIGVLRTYAEPLLYSVSKNSDNYEESIRILKFLRGFINIPSEYVPSTSILREFIGNSYFE